MKGTLTAIPIIDGKFNGGPMCSCGMHQVHVTWISSKGQLKKPKISARIKKKVKIL